MTSSHSWQYDEMQQAGLDYTDSARVQIYDAQHSQFRDVEKENEDIIECIGLTQHHRVLDMGTGTGAFALQAARCCERVYAVDVSRAMLDYASEKAKMQE